MKLGISGKPDSIQLAKAHGASGVPILVNALANEGAKAATIALRDVGLEVCQISAFGFNPLSPERAKQEEQRRLVKKAIPLAPETGCPTIVVNGGNYDPSGFLCGHPNNFGEQALDDAARGLAPLVKLAESHGVQIAVEPFIQCAVNTPERFLKLKEKIGSPALTLNLDICNFFTYEDMWKPAEAVERICKALAGQYSFVHCKDLTVSKGVHIHIDEAPLGTGVVDWSLALRHIGRDLPADGWFIYEHIKAAKDARAGMQYLGRAAEKAGVRLGGK
ncbi:MAG: sugar phosphate isomerase/epimerase [Candidatus Sumerlaeota bacterium]|nr:sugar phosphate isomerase/epimerase [Candidatus Sumerlaeota bacterium]